MAKQEENRNVWIRSFHTDAERIPRFLMADQNRCCCSATVRWILVNRIASRRRAPGRCNVENGNMTLHILMVLEYVSK
eukprot:scaffold11571_cov122-Cylindrotheca_fusiformis.AAC.4